MAWTAGILELSGTKSGVSELVGLRAARHDDFDRVVFEFRGARPGARLEYVDRPVRRCGSGEPSEIAGDVWPGVRFEPEAAHTAEGARPHGACHSKIYLTI